MAAESQATPPAAEPKSELTMNTKAIEFPAAEQNEKKECACGLKSKPKLKRNDSVESASQSESESLSSSHMEDDRYNERPIRPRRRVRHPIRRLEPFPYRDESPSQKDPTLCASSIELLDRALKFDGIAELPYPASSSVYLTTYPFTENDIKKWAWLIGSGVEEKFVVPKGRRSEDDDSEDDDERGRRGHGVKTVGNRRHDRSPFHNRSSNTVDIPSIYLSRALNTSVIPENPERKVWFLIVVQNRGRPNGAKLLVAESRKAAGILMYFEALKGESVMFVGATVNDCKKLKGRKMKKAKTLEEAIEAQEEGLVGIIC